MWSKEQFGEYLSAQLGDVAGREAIERIDAQMRRTVGVALRATCDIIEHRRNTFELFGFDFIVDEDLGVWLLEANSSPDMSTNAPPLRQIVRARSHEPQLYPTPNPGLRRLYARVAGSRRP